MFFLKGLPGINTTRNSGTQSKSETNWIFNRLILSYLKQSGVIFWPLGLIKSREKWNEWKTKKTKRVGVESRGLSGYFLIGYGGSGESSLEM